MSLDQRGQRAGADLLERARRRPQPTVDSLAEPAPEHARRGLVGALAFAAVVVLAGTAFLLTLGDTDEAPLTDEPVPVGVEPKRFAPDGLGVELQVPSTWVEHPAGRGWQFVIGDPDDDAYIVASRVTTVDDATARTFGVRRRAYLEGGDFDFTITDTDELVVDDQPAFVLRYRFTLGDGIPRAGIEYDVRIGPGEFAIVVIGEALPEDQGEIARWVGSTIAIDSTTRQDLTRPVEHPSGLPVPDGIEPKVYAPERLGARLQVPSTWEEGPPVGEGYDAIRNSTGSGFVHASRVSAAPDLGGADVLATAEVTVDGRPATVRRYRTPSFVVGFAALITETAVDMGDGTFVVVRVGETAGPQDDILDWIRSTLDLDD